MTASKGKYTISERIASLQGQGFSGNEAAESQVASGYWVTRAAAPKAEDQQRQQAKGKQLRTGWEAQRLDSEMERLKRELEEMQRIKSGGKVSSLPPAKPATTNEVIPVSSEPASKSTASSSSLSSSESASKANGVKESKKDIATGDDEMEEAKQKDEKPPAEDEVADATAKEQTTEEKVAESKKQEATPAAPSGEKQEADKSKPTQKKRFKWSVLVGMAPRRRSSRNKAA